MGSVEHRRVRREHETESAGIVDLLAIENDQREGKCGNQFEVILIQIKGGPAQRPTVEDLLAGQKLRDFTRRKPLSGRVATQEEVYGI